MTAWPRLRAIGQRSTGTVRAKAITRLTARLHQEEAVGETGVQRAGDDEDEGVVGDLHRRDRNSVAGEGEADGAPEMVAGAEHRPNGQRVTDEECERDREGDRRGVSEPQRCREHHAEHLADRAAGTIKLYVDGALSNSATATFTTTGTNSSTLDVGRAGTSNYFGGSLDELAIYGTALTASQVTDHYNKGITAPPPTVTTTNYSYDHDGNETAAGTRTITWNLAGEATAIADNGATTASFTYDGLGNRLTKTAASTTTTYLWDENADLPLLAEEKNGATVLRSYRYGMGLDPVAIHTGTSDLYFHEDLAGSTAAVTNGAGSVEWKYAYDPYGNAKSTTKVDGTAPDNLAQFTGQLLDSETGFYDLRARLYDPSGGRFLSTDPLDRDPGRPAASLFGYAAGNPLTQLDPSGQNDWEDCMTTYGGFAPEICDGFAGDPNPDHCDPACTSGEASNSMFDPGTNVYGDGLTADQAAASDQAGAEQAVQEAIAEASAAATSQSGGTGTTTFSRVLPAPTPRVTGRSVWAGAGSRRLR